MPPIIDMRNRPTWLHPFFGAAPDTPDYEVVRWLNRRVGSREIDHFTHAPDLSAYLVEIEAAGIAHAFMVGRSTPTVRIGNDAAHTIPLVASDDPIKNGSGKAAPFVGFDSVQMGTKVGTKAGQLFKSAGWTAANTRVLAAYQQGLSDCQQRERQSCHKDPN